MENNEEFPHSIALWFRWELHQRRPDGKLEGSPKDNKEYNGVLHFNNKGEAMTNINLIINKLQKELENVNRNH